MNGDRPAEQQPQPTQQEELARVSKALHEAIASARLETMIVVGLLEYYKSLLLQNVMMANAQAQIQKKQSAIDVIKNLPRNVFGRNASH